MHRIEIKNFGPIKHFEAELKDLMFFIGPQASGKSTISKIIFFCRKLPDELLSSFENMVKEELDHFPRLIDIVYLYLGQSARVYFGEIEGKFIYYINSQYSVHFQRSAENIEIFMSKSLEEQLNPLLEQFKLFKQATQTTINYQEIVAAQRIFSTNIRAKLLELFADNHFNTFIPAGRAGVARLAKQPIQLNNGRIVMSDSIPDPTVAMFLYLLSVAKNSSSTSIEQWLETAKRAGGFFDMDAELFSLAVNKVKNILKGEYRYEKLSEMVWLFFDGKTIDLERTSSGQQEVVWILYIILKLLLEKRSVFIVIEEPEAHLFPETQNQLVEFFGLFANAKPDNQLLITTHSPYILTALNNLIYAYQVGQKNPEAVNQLIPKQFWIDPRRVAAYFVENGTVRSIMDDELQHINAEEIDRASDLTNSLHEQLLEVELAGESDGM